MKIQYYRVKKWNRNFNNILFVILYCLVTSPFAQKCEYFPDSLKYGKIWRTFYSGNHEPELDDPLIKAGKPMASTICKAICFKDMKYRRYAIGAIGFIADTSSLTTLFTILNDTTEKDYFRGDALQAIYKIDNEIGETLSEQFKVNNGYLGKISQAIKNKESWLLMPSEE